MSGLSTVETLAALAAAERAAGRLSIAARVNEHVAAFCRSSSVEPVRRALELVGVVPPALTGREAIAVLGSSTCELSCEGPGDLTAHVAAVADYLRGAA